ncbi:plant UBX domain-containing protein 8 [Quillaja saponaria]|uniref:Plant UBX domain-containing protein 8 n=1 Tax=Quillaja saponaria TaxID=32244 RepID=A0AAD7KSD0_QUISA|nr:plant UBX domain-containing protein 8 [Quillaja saponaria]
MLEAAMSGGVPEGSRYFGYAPHHVMQPEDYPRPTPHPPSPALAAQQSIREQQDGEYFASLQADREIELKAMEEAESALEEERQRLEEFHRKLQEEQSLFDFMDIGRVVKPGTYRLVRSYPRRASSDGESALTLNELDLTSNQEATIHLGLCCSDKIDMKLFIYNNP